MLEVKKNTYAFSISDMSGDPQEAAAVANTAAEIFLAHNAEAYKREAETSVKFIDSRLKESETILRDAREALQRFKDKAGVFAINDESPRADQSGVEPRGRCGKRRGSTRRVARVVCRWKTAKSRARRPRLPAFGRHSPLYKADLVGLARSRSEPLGELELAVSVAQQDYESIRKKYEESRIAEQTSFAEIPHGVARHGAVISR